MGICSIGCRKLAEDKLRREAGSDNYYEVAPFLDVKCFTG